MSYTTQQTLQDSTSRKEELHPKSIFALFLNQAVHNTENALKVVLKPKGKNLTGPIPDIVTSLTDKQFELFERNFFRFLVQNEPGSLSTGEIIAIKKKQFCQLFEVLNQLRNYFSHFYYSEKVYITDSSIVGYLENKFEEAKDALLKDYNEEDLKHLDRKEKEYTFFYPVGQDTNKWGFDSYNKALIFLASFFLDKCQCNLLMSKSRGFKKAFDKPSQATRDVFLIFI